MINDMHTEQFTRIPGNGRGHTAHGPKPGRDVARADRLRSLFAAGEYFIAAATEPANEASSPTEAAALALIVERARRRTAYTKILAAQAALAHELPIETFEQLSATIADPAPFLAGDSKLPEDPASAPTGRLPHRDTVDLLQHLLGTVYLEVRDRVGATGALLPHVDINEIIHPPRYPRLSADAQAGSIDPKHAIQAAKKLDKAAPAIRMQPEPAQWTSTLESLVLGSLHTQGPQPAGKMITVWRRSLEESTASEPSEEEVSAETGIFLTRRTRRFSYFSLCMLNAEAEKSRSGMRRAPGALRDLPRRFLGGRRADQCREFGARLFGPHDGFHSGKIKLVRDSDGLPAVMLPKYLDPEQLPRRNNFWQLRRQTNPGLF